METKKYHPKFVGEVNKMCPYESSRTVHRRIRKVLKVKSKIRMMI